MKNIFLLFLVFFLFSCDDCDEDLKSVIAFYENEMDSIVQDNTRRIELLRSNVNGCDEQLDSIIKINQSLAYQKNKLDAQLKELKSLFDDIEKDTSNISELQNYFRNEF